MDCVSFPPHFNVIDTSSIVMTGDILFPFAFDEVHGKQVGQELLAPIVHIWRHQKAFVLGARDRKLPYVSGAIRWLESQGYWVSVRNSGGAAVPLDSGVVNISLILPNLQRNLDVQRHFEMMADFIRESLQRFSCRMETGEVRGSYCPGEFDVSITGKKFCGIAQRRQTKAVVVQTFVLVEGSGEERGRLVKAFYEIASGGSSEMDYPRVKPEFMASLSELIGVSSVQSYVGLVKEYLSLYGSLIEYQSYSSFSLGEVEKTIADLRARCQLKF